MKVQGAEQRLVIPDVVVTPGDANRFRGLLPSLDLPYYGGQDIVQADMTVQFVSTAGDAFPIENQPLMFTSPTRQSFLLGVCDPGMADGVKIDRKYADGLAFEEFNPLKDDHSLNTSAGTYCSARFSDRRFGILRL